MLDVAHEDHGDLGAGGAALGVEDRLRAAHRAADKAGCIGPRERLLCPAGHAAGVREGREVGARADVIALALRVVEEDDGRLLARDGAAGIEAAIADTGDQ